MSGWLRKFPLSKEQIRLLRDVNEIRIEKFRKTMLLKKEKMQLTYYDQSKKLLPFSEKELFLAGIFLYWGEGGKTEPSLISISNTNPAVLLFTLIWMEKSLKVQKEKIRILLHLYEDMDIQESINYWSTILNIPKQQFIKPYIKKSKRASLDEKGFGHGTCNVRVSNAILKSKILMTIKMIGDYSGMFYPKSLI